MSLERACFRARRGPPLPQLRKREVSRELPAAVPDGPPVPGGVVGQADRVPGHLTRAGDAVPLTGHHAGLGEAGEELLLCASPGRRHRHLAAQRHPGRFAPAAPGCLLRFGTGGAARRGAIRRGSHRQPEPHLNLPAGVAHLQEVVPDPRPGSVLPGQGGDDVNVVRRVPDRDPPHPQVVVRGGEPGPVHDRGRSFRPLRVRQHPVAWRGPERAMPHRLRVPRPAQRSEWLGQQPRSADGDPVTRPGAVPAPDPADHRTRQPGVDRCAHWLSRARTGNKAAARHLSRGALSRSPECTRSVTEHYGATAPPSHPAAGSPARRTAPPEPNHRHAGRSHSAWQQPDSGSSRLAAPGLRP